MSSLSASDRGRVSARPRWFDPRLAIGLVLVGASVAGVVAVMTAADRSVTVYSAGAALAVGDVVTTDDLVETRVRLGDDVSGRYLTPESMPDSGVVATRTIGSGELIPSGAVGDSASEDWASIVVEIAGELPRSVAEGTLVDLWAVGGEGGAESTVPTDRAPGVIAAEVTVVEVTDDESMVAGSSRLGVELVVPRDRVARILQARAAGDLLSLVPSALPLGS